MSCAEGTLLLLLELLGAADDEGALEEERNSKVPPPAFSSDSLPVDSSLSSESESARAHEKHKRMRTPFQFKHNSILPI